MSDTGPSRRPAVWAAILLVACLAAVPSTQQTTRPATQPSTRPAIPADVHTPFVSVLLRDWPTWDRDGDGVLSKAEIDRAVRDPAVRGDDAAAAASLKLLTEGAAPAVHLPPLTRAYFEAYDRKLLALLRRRRLTPGAATRPAAAETATADTIDTPAAATTAPAARPAVAAARLPADWDLYFAASRARIARGGPDPWPGRLVLDHTRQGPLGDCYFVAAVGDLVARNPARVSRLATPVGGGQFRVAFPGCPAVTVGPLTDAELAISSTTAGDGVWLALLEQALGRTKSRAVAGTDDVEGVDQIRNGGSITFSIRLLSGHPAARFRFARTLEGRRAASAKWLPFLRQQLVDALDDGRMVLAGVSPPDPVTPQQAATRPALTRGTLPAVPPNVTLRHAYAVLDYDPVTDVVTFWNPHGQSFRPTGPAGLANGYPTDHGRFRVPMSQAEQFVTSFAWERPAGPETGPAPRP